MKNLCSEAISGRTCPFVYYVMYIYIYIDIHVYNMKYIYI